MFAEDVELLPEGSFKGLLAKHRANPPVLARMLEALWREMDVGGFSVALEQARPEVPESADFVMFWWEHGACAVRSGKTRRFGVITPNSVRQTFGRRVVEGHLHPRAPSGAKAVKTAHTSSATQPVRPERSEGSDPLPIKPFAAGSGRTVLNGQTSPTFVRRTKTRRYAEW